MLTTKITNLAEGKAYIKWLCESGNSYHLEDDAADIGNFIEAGIFVPTFNPDDAAEYNARAEELYGLDWGEHDCPIGYMLLVLDY